MRLGRAGATRPPPPGRTARAQEADLLLKIDELAALGLGLLDQMKLNFEERMERCAAGCTALPHCRPGRRHERAAAAARPPRRRLKAEICSFCDQHETQWTASSAHYRHEHGRLEAVQQLVNKLGLRVQLGGDELFSEAGAEPEAALDPARAQ